MREEAAACQRRAEVILGFGPIERHSLSGQLLQGSTLRGNRRLQPYRSSLSLTDHPQHLAQVNLSSSPIERIAVAGYFL